MFNISQLMQQAQEMQKKMQNMQEDLERNEFEGKAGANLVTITVNGKGNLVKIKIDPKLLVENEKEILEDLIVAAFNDAKQKCDKSAEDIKANMFGGLALPPGFKMPF